MKCCTNCGWCISPDEENKTYCLYDKNYLGEGCFIIQEVDNDIVRFVKISRINSQGFPHYFISGYEKDSHDLDNQELRVIKLSINKSENNRLYECFQKLSLLLGENEIYSIDPSNQGKNHFRLLKDRDTISLELCKDVYGVKNKTDYINIDIGDNNTCKQYNAIFNFYNNLYNITEKTADDILIKKLIKE